MRAKPIVLGGRTYRSLEEMPPEVREKYELAMCLLGDPDENNLLHTVESLNRLADPNGHPSKTSATGNITMDDMQVVPDGQDLRTTALARAEETPFQPSSSNRTPAAVTTPDKPLPVSPTIAPDRSNGWSLVFAILFLLILCALAITGVWYFFLH